MHGITKRRLREFWERIPEAESPLSRWYKIVSKAHFDNFGALKEIFHRADKVDQFTIFDISGNKYRVISVIHFDRQKLYIRYVLTHQDYDTGTWRE